MTEKLDSRSKELRKSVLNMVDSARRGHIGSAFSLIEILRVLYDDILKYNPKEPKWDDRDRMILSKGHGCLALYAILADKGFISKDELKKFCAFDGLIGGHPETTTPGVEASTGSLGHGPSIGIGFALNARFEKKKHRIFVIIGDGESNEGSVWEAAMCAGKHGLDNFTILMDYNKHQSCGSTKEILNLEPLKDKWESFGFAVEEVDGHDVKELKEVLSKIPFEAGKPNVVICHTVKGKGISSIENDCSWHHKSKISDDVMENMFKELNDYNEADK